MFKPIRPSAHFRCLMLNLGVNTKSTTEPFISNTGVECSNSVNHDRVQVLSYNKYSLLVLSVWRIE